MRLCRSQVRRAGLATKRSLAQSQPRAAWKGNVTSVTLNGSSGGVKGFLMATWRRVVGHSWLAPPSRDCASNKWAALRFSPAVPFCQEKHRMIVVEGPGNRDGHGEWPLPHKCRRPARPEPRARLVAGRQQDPVCQRPRREVILLASTARESPCQAARSIHGRRGVELRSSGWHPRAASPTQERNCRRAERRRGFRNSDNLALKLARPWRSFGLAPPRRPKNI